MNPNQPNGHPYRSYGRSGSAPTISYTRETDANGVPLPTFGTIPPPTQRRPSIFLPDGTPIPVNPHATPIVALEQTIDRLRNERDRLKEINRMHENALLRYEHRLIYYSNNGRQSVMQLRQQQAGLSSFAQTCRRQATRIQGLLQVVNDRDSKIESLERELSLAAPSAAAQPEQSPESGSSGSSDSRSEGEIGGGEVVSD